MEDLANGTLLKKTGLVAKSMFRVFGRENVKIMETFGLRRLTRLTLKSFEIGVRQFLVLTVLISSMKS